MPRKKITIGKGFVTLHYEKKGIPKTFTVGEKHFPKLRRAMKKAEKGRLD